MEKTYESYSQIKNFNDVVACRNPYFIYLYASSHSRYRKDAVENILIGIGEIEWIYKLARDVEGVNIEHLQDAIIDIINNRVEQKKYVYTFYTLKNDVKEKKQTDGEWLALFQKDIENTDYYRIEDTIINTKDPRAIFTLAKNNPEKATRLVPAIVDTHSAKYIYLFARNIKNICNNKPMLNTLQDAIISSDDGNYIALFAKYIKNADIPKLEQSILNCNNGYCFAFIDEVSGINYERMLDFALDKLIIYMKNIYINKQYFCYEVIIKLISKIENIEVDNLLKLIDRESYTHPIINIANHMIENNYKSTLIDKLIRALGSLNFDDSFKGFTKKTKSVTEYVYLKNDKCLKEIAEFVSNLDDRQQKIFEKSVLENMKASPRLIYYTALSVENANMMKIQREMCKRFGISSYKNSLSETDFEEFLKIDKVDLNHIKDYAIELKNPRLICFLANNHKEYFEELQQCVISSHNIELVYEFTTKVSNADLSTMKEAQKFCPITEENKALHKKLKSNLNYIPKLNK